MRVPVVNIGVVGVTVRDGGVCVLVAVWAACPAFKPLRAMCVLVVRVMDVFVRVFQRFVQVLMGMVFGHVQPHPHAHQ